MNTKPYWKFGVALALTLATGYTVCAALSAAWPGPGIELLNALFHGLDFHKLDTGEPFTLRMFVYHVRGLRCVGLRSGDPLCVGA
jgi:hypothetical protein